MNCCWERRLTNIVFPLLSMCLCGSAFMLIFAVTEQDPALGVLGSCCFSYSMVAELVVNLHCLRWVS
jgi:lipid-A-disaccharide synthase-like uncharacterized protein